MIVLIALGTLGGLTLLLAIMLMVANKKLYVYEDPRIDQVDDMLPHANCGACGYPGCRPFAEALVSGKVLPGKCTVSSDESREQIANYLGVALGSEDKQVARLACAGGINVARNKAEYKGLQSCKAASLVSGGGKGCFWGCLGFGDCEKTCDFDAIHMNQYGLPVVDLDKCTACGDCVETCPKDLFSIQPMKNHLWVACKNLEHGDVVLEDCAVGCTACGKCAMDAPGIISIQQNIPIIDYSLGQQSIDAIQRCPTGAIFWQNNDGSVTKGAESKKIIRQGKLEMAGS